MRMPKQYRLFLLFWLTLPLSYASAEGEDAPFDAELAARLSYSKSGYTTRRIRIDGDFNRMADHTESTVALRFDREYNRPAGGQAEISIDKYDVNGKIRQFWDDEGHFLYISPRMRHNRDGYYSRSRSLRAGLGKRYALEDRMKISAELGSGYREALLQDDTPVTEALRTLALSFQWEPSEDTRLKADWIDESSTRERYRTLELSLRHRLTNHLGLKYTIDYNRAYPFASTDDTSELDINFGISYRF